MVLLLRRTVFKIRRVARCLSTQEDPQNSNPQQQFQKHRLEPGEWDDDMTDPLYRPKWKGDTKIISRDDFDNRPGVSFTCEFEDIFEAQATPSWMTQKEMDEIYDTYIHLMLGAEKNNSVTSHEYVMRVLGQKFYITSDRAAGVVALKHSEEQLKRHSPHLVFEDLAKHMDEKFTFEVDDTYALYKQKSPGRFVEDVAGLTSRQKPNVLRDIDDLLDVDELERNADLAEAKKARKILDGHIYKIDEDDDVVKAPMDKNCKKILNHRPKADMTIVERQRKLGRALEPEWPRSDKKVQYKFVAQVIDTNNKKKSYVTDDPRNTIVEENGEVRQGTMDDIKNVSWKPRRNDQMFMYEIVKQGWLDRVNRQATDTWGRAPDYDPNIDYWALYEQARAARRNQGESQEEGEAATAEGETDEAQEKEGQDSSPEKIGGDSDDKKD